MKIEGYHNTERSNVEDILKNGFQPKFNEKHWLGQGIYFFSDVDIASSNIDMLTHKEEIKTIAVEIDVVEDEFLDLDIPQALNDFRRYCNNMILSYKKQGKELFAPGVDKRSAILKYRCFFLDLYKQQNNYGVVAKTFPKDAPPYAEKIEGLPYLGYPFYERYLCVKGNEYIIKKNLVEKEWLV